MVIKIPGIVRTATVLVVAFAFSGALASPAHAQVGKVDPTTQAYIDELRSNATDLGIASEVQDRLVAKLLAGQTIDADTGANLVSTSIERTNGKTVTRYVFADGSVAAGSMEVPGSAPSSTVTPNSINQCNQSVVGDVHTLTTASLTGTP
jgi:hypothetical protein